MSGDVRGMPLRSGFRVGVDVGGTFTDLVVATPEGEMRVFKVSTVTSNPSEGVLDAVEKAATWARCSVAAFLERCDLFVHGTTVATNTLLERKGAKVGCLVSEGFRDSLEIRRGYRPDPWDHRSPFPEVLVPRHLRRPVAGRLDANGRIDSPLDGEDVRDAARVFDDEGVEAIAVALYNSYSDARHETEAATILRGQTAVTWITCSSEIAPIVGEYERTSTAVLNAYIAPRTVRYLEALNERLTKLGLRRRLLLIQSNGGTVSVEHVASQPVKLLLSGPAAGVGAMKHYGRMLRVQDLVSMEIGGTSCDLILMQRGEVGFVDHLQIDGYDAATPSVDVHTIGAGGGTIARVDGAGLLRIGPQGAGAQPGPACYARGGEFPTITDAQLVLGRLSPETYAGGSMTLHTDLARRAIERHIANPLGMSCEEAAAGIVRLMEQKLLQAVQRISIEQGYDPRRFTLIAGGGAGALHGRNVAAQLGCASVFVPRIAGAFCALGMLYSDVKHDYLRVWFDPLESADPAAIERTFADMMDQARSDLEKEGFVGETVEIRRFVDVRYAGQQWDICMPVSEAPMDPSAIRARFEAEHHRLYSHTQPDGALEMTKLRVVGIGRVGLHEPVEDSVGKESALEWKDAARSRSRSVWVDECAGWAPIAIHAGQDLHPGHRIVGPAIIEEATTTILVGAGDVCEVNAASNYLIRV